MRYEYIEPFVASTKRVLEQVMEGEVEIGDIALLRNEMLKDELSVLISLKGVSEGSIIMSLDRSTATKICRLMNSDACEPASALEADTIAELANMIAGNATSSLNDLGYEFCVFPPAIAARPEVLGKTDGVEIFRVPLSTPCGPVAINVALKTD